MRFRWLRFNLRARFLLATFTLVAVLLAGFYYAVDQFTDVLEQELLRSSLGRELDDFVTDYRFDPHISPPHGGGMQGYIAHAGQPSEVPAKVAAVGQGLHQEVRLADGKEYDVGRADIGSARLYVVMDIQPVERLEAHLVNLAWLCGVSALVLALLLALWLSRVVIQPVRLLANRAGMVEPGRERPNLHIARGDPHIDEIATAFDKVLDRFDAFVAREREFTEDASHELRTPLAVIISGAQLLSDAPNLPAPARKRLERIRTAARQMHELIEALLFLARDDHSIEAEQCAIADVIREAVEMHRATPLGQGREINLSVQANPRVGAPYGLILSVINNLLRNALEHSAGGSVTVTLDDQRLVIIDTGSDMRPEDVEQLFAKRTRGPHSRGHGLGLYIVKRICDRLHWQVSASQTPAGGRFELQFRRL